MSSKKEGYKAASEMAYGLCVAYVASFILSLAPIQNVWWTRLNNAVLMLVTLGMAIYWRKKYRKEAEGT